jgi:hypothetical protein
MSFLQKSQAKAKGARDSIFCSGETWKNVAVYGTISALVIGFITVLSLLIVHRKEKTINNPLYINPAAPSSTLQASMNSARVANGSAQAPVSTLSSTSVNRLTPSATQNMLIAQNPNNANMMGGNGAVGVGNRPSQFGMLSNAVAANAPVTASAMMAANSAVANAAVAVANAPRGSIDLSANTVPQPVDDGAIGGSSFGGADLISAMDTSSKPFVAQGDAARDMTPADPNGGLSSSKLMPSSWRQTAGDAQANGAAQDPRSFARFSPTKAGFNKFIYASRHATMGINTREPNPTGGIRMDSIRPPPSLALTGESIPFGDSSHRNDYLSIASQN